MEYISSIERVRSEQKFHEGEQKGEQRGKTEMLIRLLALRFGNLPPAVQVKINAAPNTQIEAWFDRAVDAPTLDEVFQGIAH